VIFLRNVMIYFDVETKRKVVQRLMAAIKPGGHLMIGHSESLNGVNEELQPVAPSVYLKP
jgi:chemotaxis protein methyltransferase CheR